MRKLRDDINQKLKSQRVVNQIQVMPNDRWELQQEVMTMMASDPAWKAVSWKAYPAWGPPEGGGAIGGEGYFMNSDLGRKFIEHGLSLGIPNFAIHKGLPIPGFDVEHNMPIEIGDLAKAYPQGNFIIYHSGVGANGGSLLNLASLETRFDETKTDPMMHQGSNQLIAALRKAGITAENNTNVYGELGSAWSNVMNNAIAAQHLIGKLLKYLGEDHVVWGTDCILYGTPQPQIEAFRMFQITPQFQEMYGYPELTPGDQGEDLRPQRGEGLPHRSDEGALQGERRRLRHGQAAARQRARPAALGVPRAARPRRRGASSCRSRGTRSRSDSRAPERSRETAVRERGRASSWQRPGWVFLEV